jgi:hypothetical protein
VEIVTLNFGGFFTMNKRSLKTHSRNFLFSIFHNSLDALATRQSIGLAYDYLDEEKLILGFTLLTIMNIGEK